MSVPYTFYDCKFCGQSCREEDDLAAHESMVHKSMLEDFYLDGREWRLKNEDSRKHKLINAF